jgi:hypothetical protein
LIEGLLGFDQGSSKYQNFQLTVLLSNPSRMGLEILKNLLQCWNQFGIRQLGCYHHKAQYIGLGAKDVFL